MVMPNSSLVSCNYYPPHPPHPPTIVTKIEYIVTELPFPTVLPIVREHNHESIAALHRQLNAKLAYIQSTIVNGLLGLLPLTVSSAVYDTLSATVFVPPVNPDSSPLITDGSTGPQVSNIHFAFNAKTKLFKDYDLSEKYLKQPLLGAVDEMFFWIIQTKYIGYLNVTTCQIIDHLTNKYAQILAVYLQENGVALKTAYDPNLPIKSLFNQVENSVNFSAEVNTP